MHKESSIVIIFTQRIFLMPRRKKNSMLNAALRGIIAGATGTVALDTIPHLIYGIVTVATYEALSK
jgi:hypothetical protein